MSDKVKKHGEIISQDIRTTISNRYKTITKAINSEFWNSSSEILHSLYVGSYGRGTAINTSDIDILVELPQSEYQRVDLLKGNGQSRLLQSVKDAICNVYSRTDIHADGQVVVLKFSDGMKIEVVPAFLNTNIYGRKEYVYPDTNNGGNWKSTNPLSEQEAIKQKNEASRGLLFDTCKHIRAIRDEKYSSYKLPGILIDSFVYSAIGGWRWSNGTGVSAEPYAYEKHLLKYYEEHKYDSLFSPGSGQEIDTEYYLILEKVLKYMVN